MVVRAADPDLALCFDLNCDPVPRFDQGSLAIRRQDHARPLIGAGDLLFSVQF